MEAFTHPPPQPLPSPNVLVKFAPAFGPNFISQPPNPNKNETKTYYIMTMKFL